MNNEEQGITHTKILGPEARVFEGTVPEVQDELSRRHFVSEVTRMLNTSAYGLRDGSGIARAIIEGELGTGSEPALQLSYRQMPTCFMSTTHRWVVKPDELNEKSIEVVTKRMVGSVAKEMSNAANSWVKVIIPIGSGVKPTKPWTQTTIGTRGTYNNAPSLLQVYL